MTTIRTTDGAELFFDVDDFRPPWIADNEDERTAIVFHHGFARSSRWWTQWVPTLARYHRVVRFDCRGCGQSTASDDSTQWSAERLVADAMAVADHLDLARIHWIGFESGGIFGIVAAVLHPQRVSSLVLVNTPYRILESPMRLYRQGDELASEALRRLGLKEWLRRTMSNRLDVTVASPELVEWHLKEHSKTNLEVAVALQHLIELTDVFPMLGQIRIPTLMMTGDRSPNCPVADQQKMQAQIPTARPLVIFPDIGAGIQVIIPEQCAEQVLAFYASLGRLGS